MSPILYYLALNSIPGLGPKTLRALLEKYGDIVTIFHTSEEELTMFPRITADIAARIRQAGENWERFEEMLLEMEKEGVWLTCWEDETYPALLRRIDDPPPLLYLRGQWQQEDDHAVAIVGSREASPAGCSFAMQIAGAFAERGLTVVSGFARGIDTAAHLGAIEAGGRTVGVLGNGIDRVHPASNRELAERAIRQGILLTEFPPGTRPQGRTLMARDRIISGLAQAVIVVEAGLQSGSLDTAARALKQGRRLYAVDWSGTEVKSNGTAHLIHNQGSPLPPRCEDIDFEALVGDILEEDPLPTGLTPPRKDSQLNLFD